jgi:phosphoribosylanthranilate isomerase
MSASLKVKICGVTREEDALGACGAGADLLGFNFVPGSKRYLNPYLARDIIAGLPPFVSRVGVFADEELVTVNELSAFLGLDAVQLHGHEDPEYCRKVKKPVIKAVRVAEAVDLAGLEVFKVSAFLLDAKVEGELGGTGRSFPWELAVDLCRSQRVFVAGGLDQENVAEAVRVLTPYGVDTASGVESGPGVKDPVLVEGFIEAAREAAVKNRGGSDNVACQQA